MDSGWDLIEHFKLNAEFLSNCTKHTFSTSDRVRGRRKVMVEETWKMQNQVDQGASGPVWLEVEEQSKKERAVKEIRKNRTSSSGVDYYKRELLAMAKLSKYQEVFVQFYGWFDSGDIIFLAMEYFEYGNLQNCITEELTEGDAKIVTGQLLEGLKILHENGFTHRDLKPQNIFVASKSPDWWIKIGDFGLTKRIESDLTALRTYAGTQHFQAPEILGYVDEESSEYTNAVDLWSLGCVAYELLTQKVPFSGPRDLSLYCKGAVRFPNEPLVARRISAEGIMFIESLMVPEPSKRSTADAVSRAPWLKTVDTGTQQISLREEVLRLTENLTVTETSKRSTADAVSRAPWLKTLDAQVQQSLTQEEVRQLLYAVGYNVKADDFNLGDALVWAAGCGHKLVVQLLLERRAILEEEDKSERTALHSAAKHGHEAVVRLLLATDDAEPNSYENHRTPLSWAAAEGHESVVQLLLASAIVDVNSRDFVSLQSTQLSGKTGKSGYRYIPAGRTPLLWTAEKGHEAVVRLLLEKGADIEAKSRGMRLRGKTALHWAAEKGHKSVVELLLEKGSNINAVDQNGETALHRAAQNWHK